MREYGMVQSQIGMSRRMHFASSTCVTVQRRHGLWVVSSFRVFTAALSKNLFGSALSMTSIALGNYLNAIISKFSSSGGNSGWISRDLNDGHLDRFFYLLATLGAADFVVYCLVCISRRDLNKVAVENIKM